MGVLQKDDGDSESDPLRLRAPTVGASPSYHKSSLYGGEKQSH